MAILVQYTQSGVTPDQYDAIRKEVRWEEAPPAGAMFHAAGFQGGELRSVDIWNSQAEMERYYQERLAPVAAKAGVTLAAPVPTPIHLMAYVPELLAGNAETLRAAAPA